MRSVRHNFEKILKRNPGWSSCIAFANAVDGKRYSRKMISCWFSKLVDKNDYCRSERKQLIEFLYSLSNPLEEGQKQTKN
ncbi:MAG: hypothetical protein WCW16_03065 [Candidatus Magasanikbacteria bacterium]